MVVPGTNLAELRLDLGCIRDNVCVIHQPGARSTLPDAWGPELPRLLGAWECAQVRAGGGPRAYVRSAVVARSTIRRACSTAFIASLAETPRTP